VASIVDEQPAQQQPAPVPAAGNRRALATGCGLAVTVVLLLCAGLLWVRSAALPPTVLGALSAEETPVPATGATAVSVSAGVVPTAEPTDPPEPTPAPTATPSPTPAPSPTAAVDPAALEPGVRATYARYWRDRAAAYRRLDARLLRATTADPLLDREAAAIAELRSNGQYRVLVFDHDWSAEVLSPDRARVLDSLLERSRTYDLSTNKLVEGERSRRYTVRFELRRTDRGWRLVDATREE
jgi:hypothetical protein